jgi:hypothetical protein
MGPGAVAGFAGKVVEAVERERRRRLTGEERTDALADMRKLEEVEEAKEGLTEVKALLAPLIEECEDDDEFPLLRPLLFPGDEGDGESNVLKLGTI